MNRDLSLLLLFKVEQSKGKKRSHDHEWNGTETKNKIVEKNEIGPIDHISGNKPNISK